jgi:hypothetical protein
MVMTSKIEPSVKALDFTEDKLKDLISIAKHHNKQYLSNKPFPHIVIDGLFPDDILKDVLTELSNKKHDVEKNFFGSIKKFATPNPWDSGATTRRLLLDLNSSNLCLFLEELTSIEGVVPDPYYEGGGVHETLNEGFLKVHTDFNWHKKLKLDRRINVIIYLNKDWDEQWGGGLELWDKNMEKKCVEVSPAFNRTVIFSTTDFSFHGHPDPIKCPVEESRKSLALYYYSNGRPQSEIKFNKSADTNYQERPDEVFLEVWTAKKVLGKLMPPILIDALRKLKK